MIGNELMFLWVALFVVFVVGEVVSLGLTSIWFAGGALAGFVTSLVTKSFIVQFGVFAVVSILLLIVTRPIAKKHFNSKNLIKTNVETIVGSNAIVKEAIDNINGKGVVVIGGVEWSARSSDDNQIIEVDKKVVVKSVKGVTVIVEE